jgi:hypothetical protein
MSSTRSHTTTRRLTTVTPFSAKRGEPYTSVSGVDGGIREVSGAVLVPRGTHRRMVG